MPKLPRASGSRSTRRIAVVVTAALGVGLLSAVAPPVAAAAPGASAGPRGAVLVDTGDAAARSAVVAVGGRLLVDYGAFGLWTVPPAGRARVAGVPGVTGDASLTRVELRNGVLATDAAVPAPTVLPAPASDARQLRLVQFVGPVREEWLGRFAAVGAQVVGYVPNNAYLVHVSAKGAAALDALVGRDAVVQYSGPFHPAFRLAPDLLAGVAKRTSRPVTTAVTVQIVEGVDADATLAAVRRLGPQLAAPYTLAGLRTVSVTARTSDLGALASMDAVVDVERYVAPVRNDEAQDQLLAGNVSTVGGRTVPTSPGYLAWLAAHGFPTTPESYPLVSVVDDGLDNGRATPLHPNFYSLGVRTNADRVTAVKNCTTDATAASGAGHGTINAGIVGGYNANENPTHQDAAGYQYGLGVSPFGRLAGVKIFRDSGAFDTSLCGGGYPGIIEAAAAQGAAFTTDSWGAPNGGAYTASSQVFDAMTRDASTARAGNQQMLHVVAAGNDGPGVNTIGSPGTGKNVLTVGATENVREEGTPDGCGITAADNDSDLATFSSRGPTDDLRVKPDLVAAGTHVEGPASQGASFNGSGVCGNPTAVGDDHHPVGSTLYTWSSGTSHSTPAVAGGASLAYQYYGREIAPGSKPSPAMLKALMVNQPRYVDGASTGGTLPSATQGWGVPDLGALFDPDLGWLTLDQSRLFTASGQTSTSVGTIVDPARATHVTLTFTDAPGQTTGNAYVNDLDLLVTAGGKTYRGNVFSGATSVTGGAGDTRDTVEKVVLPAGLSGPVSIRVVARTVAADGVPGNSRPLDQDFALLGSNLSPTTSGVAETGAPSVTDSTDADTVADPGEPLALAVPVTNTGNAALAATTGKLVKVSGPATVVRGTAAYGAIAAGASGNPTTAYRIRVAANAACGVTIVLRHTYGSLPPEDVEIVLGGSPQPSGTYTTTTTSDPPLAIPDDTDAGVASTLTLTESRPIADLRVVVWISHTYDADLALRLVGPDGTEVALATAVGGGGDNFSGTVFDDAAPVAIAAGTPPFAGSFRPEQPLSAFDGRAAAGVWTLVVSDTAAQDTGQLDSWSLSVDPQVGGACTPLQPYLELLDVGRVTEGSAATAQVTLLNRPATGTVTVRVQTQAGTATAADFTAVSQLLTWTPATAATQTVSVPTVADGVSEPDERFTVLARNPTVPVTTPSSLVVVTAN